MTLVHTPACNTFIPDRFLDTDSGRSYVVRQDVDAEDPRRWADEEQVALYVIRGSRGKSEIVPDNIACRAFDYFHGLYVWDDALKRVKRYLAVFHPELKIAVSVETIRGHVRGDWAGIFVAVTEGNGTIADHVKTFQQWSYGDVWMVIPDNPGSAVGGIYADSPEDAVEQFRENYEDKFVEFQFTTTIRADDEHSAQLMAQRLIDDMMLSGWLPSGAKIQLAHATDKQDQGEPV